ncbi:hypothetical protein ACO0K9_00270 [Undibacterium sp. Ji50W]|uniref:hypothetical protein n=1 Tax=Undibacterium sp. Ji50W TaxID=3413041 RepID=UPI003BF09F40
MKKVDIKLFEELASLDDVTRLAAAVQLQRLEHGYFDQFNTKRFRFKAEQIQCLVLAWHTSSNALVRLWVAQLLAITKTDTDEVLALLREAVHLDGKYIPTVAEFLRNRLQRIPDGLKLFRSLSQHPSDGVRLSCAMVLGLMIHDGTFDYEIDLPILRTLMLDTYSYTRTQAVSAARYINLGPADFEVLLDVVNIDSGAARDYARELMSKLENILSNCKASAFAPRVPLLRIDGVYRTEKAELDPAGAWVSSGCLRFFDDATVQYFGTNIAPVDFRYGLADIWRCNAKGVTNQAGGKIAFSLEGGVDIIDCEGYIDGDRLQLVCSRRSSGMQWEEGYRWAHVDWCARASEVNLEAIETNGRTQNETLPFIPQRPRSMRISDSVKWYIQYLARLPSMIEQEQDEAKRVALAWRIKRQLRDVAADALYSTALKKEFYAKLPLPTLNELRSKTPAEAIKQLLTVTQVERRAFPGTVGEFIGLQYFDGRHVWEMTEEGWALKR